MSINFTILGLLSAAPQTGYELKKIIQDSPFMYWSGNNNQIYKAVLELSNEGYVTGEMKHQEKSPSKKVYTITEEGLAALKKWLQTIPEAPQLKKPFLVQLAWTQQLSSKEIIDLLDRYEQETKAQIAVEQDKRKKGYYAPNRSERETAIWKAIYDNMIESWSNELNWIANLRRKIESLPDVKPAANKLEKKEESQLNYQVIEKNNIKYLLFDTEGRQIERKEDGLDLISICAQHDTNLLLIKGERLSDDFLRLSTGVAGEIIQKFANYSIKAVVVLDAARTTGRFKEFLLESQGSSTFRAYDNYEDAETWLIS